MSCGVAAIPSPFQETSLFEDEWQSCVGDGFGDLGAIAEFNANSSQNNNSNNHNSFSIDPHLLSNPSSPASSCDIVTDFSPNNGFATSQPSIEQTNVFDKYPPVNTAPTTTPYYHQSIKGPSFPQETFYQPSPLRNQLHRRSVSEPPTGPTPDGHHYQMPTMPTFTREGHALGVSTHRPSARQNKSTPKTTRQQYRREPYPAQHPYPPAQRAQQMQRAQTQPMRPQTSTPQMPGMVFNAAPPVQFISSRKCTPAALPEKLESPMSVSEKNVVSIPLAVNELRAIITDAVQKAIKEVEDQRVKETASGPEESKVEVKQEAESIAEEDKTGDEAALDDNRDLDDIFFA